MITKPNCGLSNMILFLNKVLSSICVPWQNYIKNNNIRLLSDVYLMLGCSKASVSRWEYNPCSTQLSTKQCKLGVIAKSEQLFNLTKNDCEILANKAGISFCKKQKDLINLLQSYPGKYHDLLKKSAVSERMFQYYLNGKEPTKQALLALAISLNLPLCKIKNLLLEFGYCLSLSLPNDAIVLWFLNQNYNQKESIFFLESINELLDFLEMPLLMTKLINR